MQGIEIDLCNAAIRAALSANQSLINSTVAEALSRGEVYGKPDTLGFDANSEIRLVGHLTEYDRSAVVITEETGRHGGSLADLTDLPNGEMIYVADPIDRSRQLEQTLQSVPDKSQRISALVRHSEFVKNWEREHGSPACITGASSSITCIRHGVPIFSVIVNVVTQQLFVSCSAGNYMLNIPEDRNKTRSITVDYTTSHGRNVFFRDLDHTDVPSFVTFLGKTGYRENLTDSKLLTEQEIDQNIHYPLPGGPLRVLYLSTLQPDDHEIGFILANGEKIVEWIHWLPFVRFARKKTDQGEPALRMYEVWHERPWTREAILMATPPPYSPFKQFSREDQRMVIDVRRFSDFGNPSQIRATLIVTPYDNDWAAQATKRNNFRLITPYPE